MTPEPPAAPARAASLAEALRLLDGSALAVREESCVNLRGRVAYCDRCAHACPAQALAPGVDAVELDEAACTGCGACVPACPAGALSLSGFAPERFLDALAGRALAHVHCAESRGSGGGVVLPCFALLDARLVAAALARGTRTVVLHGLERCGECHRGSATAHLDAVRATLGGWFGAAAPALEDGGRDAPDAGPRRRADQPVIGRRGFLRVAGGQGAAHAVSWLAPVAAHADGPAGIADALAFFQADALEQRPHPYQALLAQAAPDLPWVPAVELPFRVRAIGTSCSACMACGERCPTGALGARDDGRARALWHEPARCTDCGLCERLCPHGAVTDHVVRDSAELATLASPVVERRLAPCLRCGLPGEIDALVDGVCTACRNEQEMDDAWQCMLDG